MKPILLTIIITILCFSQKAFTQTPNSESADFNKRIEKIWILCGTLKPGTSTKADLLKIFVEQGGGSTPSRESFEYRGCNSIHIDAEFKIEKGRDLSDRRPTDIITKISSSYIGNSVWD